MSTKTKRLLGLIAKNLAPLGAFRARAMFGGYGLYLDDAIFGIIAFDQLYLKVDEINRGDFVNRGSEPFTYYRGDVPAVMKSYWSCPEEVMGSPSKMRRWVEGACSASRRSRV